MKRVLQKLFLNAGQDLNSPENIDLAYASCILDGWFVKAEVQGIHIAPPTANSMSIWSMGIGGNPEVQTHWEDGADYWDIFEDAPSHDLIWIHGNREEMPKFCMLVSPDIVTADDFFHVKKNFRLEMQAGDQVRQKFQIANLNATSNIASDINMDVTQTFAVNAYRKDYIGYARHDYFRVIGKFNGAEKIEKATLQPPCEGYYTNMSLQIIFPDIANNPMAMNHFMLTKNIDDRLLTDLVDTTGESITLPDYKTDGLYLDIPRVNMTDGGVFKAYWKHWGNKRLYINNKELLHMFVLDLSATPEHWLLFQADFVPKRGAVYSKSTQIGSITESDDLAEIAGRQYTFPIDLADAQIKVELSTIANVAPYRGELWFMVRKKGQDIFTDTINSGLGDIIDSDLVDQSNMGLHGFVGKMNFHTTWDASASPQTLIENFETVLKCGNVRKGDMVTWDVRQLGTDDTLQGVFEMRFILAGKIVYSSHSKDGDWLQYDNLCNLNEQEAIS